MLRIEKSANKEFLTLSGRMGEENVAELDVIVRSEAADRDIAFDLKDLILVDRDSVRFLKRCEAEGILLRNCPAYVREWIEREETADGAAQRPAAKRQKHLVLGG
jgi:NAD-dependent dihydropyrimidine dehydrogenase PreA subunit